MKNAPFLRVLFSGCRVFFGKVLQNRGLNLLQSQGIQVLLGNVASKVTKDEVRRT